MSRIDSQAPNKCAILPKSGRAVEKHPLTQLPEKRSCAIEQQRRRISSEEKHRSADPDSVGSTISTFQKASTSYVAPFTSLVVARLYCRQVFGKLLGVCKLWINGKPSLFVDVSPLSCFVVAYANGC